MRKYAMEIAHFTGRRGKSCYFVLGCAVEVALQHMPKELPMKDICVGAGELCNKSEKATYKALSRVAKDIWEHGNKKQLEEMIGFTLYEKPSPKDLVIALAQALWCKETEKSPSVEYHILEGGVSKELGIWGRAPSSDDCFVIIAPFCSEREEAEKIVARLNQEQVTVQKFKELLSDGKIFDFNKPFSGPG